MPKRIKFEGKSYVFPDDATDEEISRALAGEQPSRFVDGLKNLASSALLAAGTVTDAVSKAAQYTPVGPLGMNPRFTRAVEQKLFGRTFAPSPFPADEPVNATWLVRLQHQMANMQNRAAVGMPKGLSLGLIDPQGIEPYAAGAGIPTSGPFKGIDFEQGAVESLGTLPAELALGHGAERALATKLAPGVARNFFGNVIGSMAGNAGYLEGDTNRDRALELLASMGIEGGIGLGMEGIGGFGRGVSNAMSQGTHGGDLAGQVPGGALDAVRRGPVPQAQLTGIQGPDRSIAVAQHNAAAQRAALHGSIQARLAHARNVAADRASLDQQAPSPRLPGLAINVRQLERTGPYHQGRQTFGANLSNQLTNNLVDDSFPAGHHAQIAEAIDRAQRANLNPFLPTEFPPNPHEIFARNTYRMRGAIPYQRTFDGLLNAVGRPAPEADIQTRRAFDEAGLDAGPEPPPGRPATAGRILQRLMLEKERTARGESVLFDQGPEFNPRTGRRPERAPNDYSDAAPATLWEDALRGRTPEEQARLRGHMEKLRREGMPADRPRPAKLRPVQRGVAPQSPTRITDNDTYNAQLAARGGDPQNNFYADVFSVENMLNRGMTEAEIRAQGAPEPALREALYRRRNRQNAPPPPDQPPPPDAPPQGNLGDALDAYADDGIPDDPIPGMRRGDMRGPRRPDEPTNPEALPADQGIVQGPTDALSPRTDPNRNRVGLERQRRRMAQTRQRFQEGSGRYPFDFNREKATVGDRPPRPEDKPFNNLDSDSVNQVFDEKFGSEFSAGPGFRALKQTADKFVREVGDRLFRERDQDYSKTAGIDPEGVKPQAPAQRVGFPGRGFGAPKTAATAPGKARPGASKQLGGGLAREDAERTVRVMPDTPVGKGNRPVGPTQEYRVGVGKATNVVGRLGELSTSALGRAGQKVEMATRKGALGLLRRLSEVNFKLPTRVVKWLGKYRGGMARVRRLLRGDRIAIAQMNVDMRAQRRWVNLREIGDPNPERVLPVELRPFFKNLRLQIEAESKKFKLRCERLAEQMRKAGNGQAAKHFQELADTAEANINEYLHRSYTELPPTNEQIRLARRALEERFVVNRRGNLKLLSYDDALQMPAAGWSTFDMTKATPAQEEQAARLMTAWVERVMARKETVQTPQMGQAKVGGGKITRKRLLNDPAMRLLRGQDKQLLNGANTLGLIRAKNAQMDLFSRLARHMKAWERLSPDQGRALPNWEWLGEMAGQKAPKWLADLIEENFSADLMGPAELKWLADFMKYFKFKSTVLNPASYKNQLGQNLTNLWLAGVNPFDPRNARAGSMAVREFIGGSRRWGDIAQRLERDGVLEAFTEAEFQASMREELDRLARSNDPRIITRTIDQIKNGIHNGSIRMSDAYSFFDRVAKTTAYIKARGLDGGEGVRLSDWEAPRKLSHEEAVVYVNDYFINFSMPSKMVSFIRNQGLAQLFVTPFFAAKVLSLPIWGRAMSRKPFTAWAFMAFASGMTTLWWRATGESEDRIGTDTALQTKAEKGKLKWATPSIGDELESLDVSNAIPNYELLQAMGGDPGESTMGDLMLAATQVFGDHFMSGPLPSAVYGKFGYDIKEEESAERQIAVALIEQAGIPGGRGMTTRVSKFLYSAANADKPGTYNEPVGSSDSPDERLVRSTLGLVGLNPKPLDARAKLLAVWENERTQQELMKRFPAVMNKLYAGEITTEEAQKQVHRLITKQMDSAMSLVPPSAKKAPEESTAPDLRQGVWRK